MRSAEVKTHHLMNEDHGRFRVGIQSRTMSLRTAHFAKSGRLEDPSRLYELMDQEAVSLHSAKTVEFLPASWGLSRYIYARPNEELQCRLVCANHDYQKDQPIHCSKNDIKIILSKRHTRSLSRRQSCDAGEEQMKSGHCVA